MVTLLREPKIAEVSERSQLAMAREHIEAGSKIINSGKNDAINRIENATTEFNKAVDIYDKLIREGEAAVMKMAVGEVPDSRNIAAMLLELNVGRTDVIALTWNDVAARKDEVYDIIRTARKERFFLVEEIIPHAAEFVARQVEAERYNSAFKLSLFMGQLRANREAQ